MNETLINTGIYVTYALLALTVVGILLFSLWQVVKNPAGAKSALAGIVALVVILLVSYGISTGSDLEIYAQKLEVAAETSQQVGTGLLVFYVLGALAILSILYSEITSIFK